ncbi:hypothetical protein BKA16_001186 [Gordonia humi]|uniref:Uncharacterized protein n=1 Tax=Gordonia humi TaxID=686429 RepID=A0A840EWF6_9ACTN|nr:hypothetical protein [Gordonia humi]
MLPRPQAGVDVSDGEHRVDGDGWVSTASYFNDVVGIGRSEQRVEKVDVVLDSASVRESNVFSVSGEECGRDCSLAICFICDCDRLSDSACVLDQRGCEVETVGECVAVGG